MVTSQNKLITISGPKSYDFIGARFYVIGYVSKKLFENQPFQDLRLSVELLDYKGKVIIGSTATVEPVTENKEIYGFLFPFELSPFQYNLYKESQGRVTLCLSDIRKSSLDNEREEVYLPLIIKEFIGDNEDTERISDLQATTRERIKVYRNQTKDYHKELSDLHKRREEFYRTSLETRDEGSNDITDENLTDELFWDLGGGYEERKKIDEKYKDSIEWTGPLVTGILGRQNGFDFRVYSNDHGKHFHVIHKERMIDARFSFPELELINHKGRNNKISKKDMVVIKTFFSKPENFARLRDEFEKRI